MSAVTTPVAEPFLVGIAGGSGSGKTALACRLAAALGQERVALVSQDAYYRDRTDLDPAARAAIDFDSPDALDHARFVEDLGRLRRGQPIRPPRYCFVTHCRLGGGEPVVPRQVVIVDGILLFHDPEVCGALDLRIFVDAPSHVRLTRRIARDTAERGRTADAVVRQFRATVSPAHARYVEPTKALADLVLLNVSRLEPMVEVAATVVRGHLARREDQVSGARRLA